MEAMAREPTPEDRALVARYLTHVRVEKRLALRTQTLYTRHLDDLLARCAAAGVGLRAVQPAHVRGWVAALHAAGHVGHGIALVLSVWRGFYTWLGREGMVRANPVQGIRAPKQQRALPKALGVDDAMQLANYVASDADPWLEARDEAMVELLYGCGLRVGELAGLDVAASDGALHAGRGWIDLDGAEVQVQGKGSKRRTVPLGHAAIAALKRWLALRPARPAQASAASALFLGQRGTRLTTESAWKRLRSRSLRAGLATPVHPHMLRHSYASHLLQSSGDLRGVQELLGHANIGTTQIYTRLDFQHLAKEYDAAHPRAHRKGGTRS
ncbi:MAG: tyrosine recombinase XerC [Burkholderiaceae bacterium]|nr:MAG: tyrosine recombinase XerC [Burkholderiaceae bacterium]